MKRGHCSTFAVPHTSISITPLSSGTAPCPSASAAGAAPASCEMEEVLRDPPVPWSRGCATPREVKQLLQDANLLEPQLGVTAPILLPPRALPHPAVPDCSGKVPRQQNGRAGPAQLLLLPPPPAHPCGTGLGAAPTEHRPRELILEGKASFLALLVWPAPHLPVPKDRSFAPAWVSCAGSEAGDPAGPCLFWMVNEIPEVLQPKALGRGWKL